MESPGINWKWRLFSVATEYPRCRAVTPKSFTLNRGLILTTCATIFAFRRSSDESACGGKLY